MPDLKQARINAAKNNVRKFGDEAAVKEFGAFKLVFFNDLDVVAWFDRATTRYDAAKRD